MATVSPAIVDCAPGNALSLTSSGLSDGSAHVVMAGQGIVNQHGVPTGFQLVVIPATVTSNKLAFTIPDGLSSGPAIASEATPALGISVAGNVATLTGTIQPGDVIAINLGAFGVAYMVVAGDTLASIAANLALAATAASIPATANGSVVTVSPTTATQTASFFVTTTANGAPFALRVASQYIQAAEYFGEGMDTSSLATGELDMILRRASALVDAFIGGTRRQLQWIEQHRYRKSRKVFWYHRPVISIDRLTFVTAQQLRSQFNIATDAYININNGYLELLSYAIGQFQLLAALEIIGFSANVIELTLTAGYPQTFYPQGLRDATQIITSELLGQRLVNTLGMGPFERIEDKLWRRKDEKGYEIPDRAKALLRPFRLVSIG